MDLLENVCTIMQPPEWAAVSVSDYGAFVTIGGFFRGKFHGGWRSDWKSLAEDLDRHARFVIVKTSREEPMPAPVVEQEPPPPPEPPAPDLIIDNEMLSRRVADLQSGLEDQRAEIERLLKENAALRAAMPPPEFAQDVPKNLEEKLSDFGPVADDTTTDQLITQMQEATDPTQDKVAKMTRAKRKKFTELLNVELAELQQARGTVGENLKREANIESLLGLFARVGEK